jgi:hypothetical protein
VPTIRTSAARAHATTSAGADTRTTGTANSDPVLARTGLGSLTSPWATELAKWQRGPGNGSKPAADRPRYLAEPQEALAELQSSIASAGNGPVRLDDGRTIITHDVVLTAASELARAVAVNNVEVPSTEQVRENLSDLNAAYRIRGASGWICLTNAGNPYDKALSVVRLDPTSARPKFEGVAWPEGVPLKDNCVVPQITR